MTSPSTPRTAPARSPQEYASLKRRIDRVLEKNPNLPAAERAQLSRTSHMIGVHLADPKLRKPALTSGPRRD